MKKLSNKSSRKEDKGIAIIVSMSLLVIFFLLGFGFMGSSISANSMSSVRTKIMANKALTNKELINEAIQVLEEHVYVDSTATATDAKNFSRFSDVTFTEGDVSNTNDITFKAIGTRSSNNTDLSTFLKPLWEPDDGDLEYYILNAPNYGWIENQDLNGDGTDDQYSWMILDANGLDPNYIGGRDSKDTNPTTDTETVSEIREGKYIRELDLANLNPTIQQVVLTIYLFLGDLGLPQILHGKVKEYF